MDDWFETPVTIDDAPPQSSPGHATVAKADGILHHRELILIASFESRLPPGTRSCRAPRATRPSHRLPSARSSWSRSPTASSPTPSSSGSWCCAGPGDRPDRVARGITGVKRRFLAVFAGVHFFRDAVVRSRATSACRKPRSTPSGRGVIGRPVADPSARPATRRAERDVARQADRHLEGRQLRRGHRFSTDDLVTAWRASAARPDAGDLLDLGAGSARSACRR